MPINKMEEEIKIEPPRFEEVKPGLWVKRLNNGKYIHVYPIQKDPNKKEWKGNVNWKNLIIGDKKMYIFWVMMIILLFAYKNDVESFKEVYENPCAYCDYQLYSGIKNVTFECDPNKGLCIQEVNLSGQTNNLFTNNK